MILNIVNDEGSSQRRIQGMDAELEQWFEAHDVQLVLVNTSEEMKLVGSMGLFSEMPHPYVKIYELGAEGRTLAELLYDLRDYFITQLH